MVLRKDRVRLQSDHILLAKAFPESTITNGLLSLLAELEELPIPLTHFLAIIVNHEQVLLVAVVNLRSLAGSAEELVVDFLCLLEIGI